jgi:eukaryotic-like serine/threonine-protein kinase
VAGAWFVHRQSKIRWAREQAVPEIERLILAREPGFANYPKAYRQVVEAEKYISGDPVLNGAREKCSMRISIKTEPPGATVHRRELFAVDQQWRPLGVTPIEKVRLPAGLFWWKFEKQGYETVLAMAPTFRPDVTSRNYLVPSDIFRVLDPVGKIPPGMVRVLGGETTAGQVDDFFIDKYEVTNKQYKEFVDSGGYGERKNWKHPFVKDGKKLNWEQAMVEFRDQTGRLGPATWQAGAYPPSQGAYPVAGVSWYEAAAYAEYAGKSLPTLWHWGLAAGQATPLWEDGWLGYVSNFKGEGPAPVGSYPSMTAYGAFDMAGNVREWCWNETREGRVLRGGAWNDATYMAIYISQSPAFDRSPKSGFRCVLYRDRSKIPAKAFEPYEVAATDYPNFMKQKPVPDSVFAVYKDQFSYDKKELSPRVEWRNEGSADWIQEKVIVDAAYGSEKLPIYVFLPKGRRPPYQAVVYFPGSGSASHPSSKDLEHYREFDWFLSFVVKNGRAVVYPVYKGTFERGDAALAPILTGASTRQYTEYLIQWVKDLRRSIDYLETRRDIDSGGFAYLGYSWGGRMAPIILASEERLKAGVVVVGGMRARERPEAQDINYVTRVKIPTLMLNGRYDITFPYEASVKPMFDLLGTPAAHKRLVVYDTDHFVPRNELIKETLAWLDRYLGPVM